MTLRRDKLEADAAVQLPLADLILRKVQKPSYTYTLTVIRADGGTPRELTDSLDLLIPDVSV